MCLNINPTSKEHKAFRNIAVYKQLSSDGRSKCQGFKYRRFKTNKKEKLNPEYNSWDGIHLNEGYHSRKESNPEDKGHLFVLPKGSKFYEGRENSMIRENPNDGYCSETIIYIGKNNWFNRLIGRFFYKVGFKSEQQMKEERKKFKEELLKQQYNEQLYRNRR